MNKTKQYRKKNKKSRTRRRITRKYLKKNLRRSSMKGGSVIPFSDLTSAFSTLGYGLTNGISAAAVPPSAVPPNKIGGDNPLPFQQSGPASDISQFNYEV